MIAAGMDEFNKSIYNFNKQGYKDKVRCKFFDPVDEYAEDHGAVHERGVTDLNNSISSIDGREVQSMFRSPVQYNYMGSSKRLRFKGLAHAQGAVKELQ